MDAIELLRIAVITALLIVALKLYVRYQAIRVGTVVAYFHPHPFRYKGRTLPQELILTRLGDTFRLIALNEFTGERDFIIARVCSWTKDTAIGDIEKKLGFPLSLCEYNPGAGWLVGKDAIKAEYLKCCEELGLDPSRVMVLLEGAEILHGTRDSTQTLRLAAYTEDFQRNIATIALSKETLEIHATDERTLVYSEHAPNVRIYIVEDFRLDKGPKMVIDGVWCQSPGEIRYLENAFISGG